MNISTDSIYSNSYRNTKDDEEVMSIKVEGSFTVTNQIDSSIKDVENDDMVAKQHTSNSTTETNLAKEENDEPSSGTADEASASESVQGIIISHPLMEGFSNEEEVESEGEESEARRENDESAILIEER